MSAFENLLTAAMEEYAAGVVELLNRPLFFDPATRAEGEYPPPWRSGPLDFTTALCEGRVARDDGLEQAWFIERDRLVGVLKDLAEEWGVAGSLHDDCEVW